MRIYSSTAHPIHNTWKAFEDMKNVSILLVGDSVLDHRLNALCTDTIRYYPGSTRTAYTLIDTPNIAGNHHTILAYN